MAALASPAAGAKPPITAAAFTPDGKAVVVGSQAGLEVRSWPDLKPDHKLKTQLCHIHDLKFSPKGDVLAVAGGSPAEEGAVELLRWPGGKPLRRVAEHGDVVYRVAWRADGKQWVSASADGTCRVHDAKTGKVLQTFKGHSRPVLALCYTPDGKLIVSAGIDQSLRVWEANTGRQVRSLDNHVGPVHDLAPRPQPDSDAPLMLASASADKTVRLWQPTIGRMVRFKRLPSAVLAVAWSADGKRLLAACADGRLRVIDPDSLKLLREEAVLKGWLHTLAVPPRGDAVLAGGEGGELRRIHLGR